MKSEDNAELSLAIAADRRALQRFDTDGAASLLLSPERIMQCRLTDLSLGGCRLRTVERFKAEPGLQVQVAFRVNGLTFKFAGITEWTNRWNLVGVRFVDVPRRSKADLADLIGELEEEVTALAGSAFAEPADELLHANPNAPQQSHSAPSGWESAQPETEPQSRIHVVPFRMRRAGQGPALERPDPAGVGNAKPERRTQPRHAVDTAAVLQLDQLDKRGLQGFASAARLRGRILDLSASGCRIRIERFFPVGISTRVETEFRAKGVPFRLVGVIQAIHDRSVVGIRFLDVNARKRKQLEQLMLEIAGHTGQLPAQGNREGD
jgi:c-di-GMP-binding flagellar brake protein YcgR